MRASSLLGFLLLAKVSVLWGREIPLSVWTPIAYFWQDLVIVLLFAKLESVSKRPWISWGAYGLLVTYVALNASVARVLSSPLTWPMIRAARETLADSILYHVTPKNLLLIVGLIAAGAALPVVLRKFQPRMGDAAFWLALIVVAFGPLATSQVQTLGLHRNPVFALVSTSLPRVSSRASREDWRVSPFEGGRAEDLSWLRGTALGRSVILVVLESAGARYLRPYGADEDPMPNLTDLAARSVLFENAYAVYPESIKGLFSLLCSTYPAMDTPPQLYGNSRFRSISSELAGAGYRTALFHSGRFMYLGMDSALEGRGFQTLEDAGAIGGNHNSSFGVDEESTVRRMLSWIDDLSPEERFFITYLPVAGHHPYTTPVAGPFPTDDEVDRYRNALHYADSALGELLRGIRSRRLEEKTLLVVAGDHGEAFGQHSGNYGHTLFLYDENVRIPLIISAPDLVKEQVRIRRPASLLDTAPTVLDLLGLPLPRGFQGSSLLEPEMRMALFYTDYSLGLLGLRDGCMKYVYEMDSARSQLFRLCDDAEERTDVSASEPERVADYRGRLRRWAAAQKELLLQTHPNSSLNTDCH